MKGFKFEFTDEDRERIRRFSDICTHSTTVDRIEEIVNMRIESLIQARADADGCAAKDAGIAELKREITDLRRSLSECKARVAKTRVGLNPDK